MTWFLISFFTLSIYPLNLLNKFYNKKYLSLFVPISFFGLLQLFLSNFTSFRLLNYEQYKIITITLTVIYFLACIGLTSFFIFKNRDKLNKELFLNNLYETLPMISCSIIAIILLIFIETNFVDTTAYAQVSAFFQNNIYSMDGIDDLSKSYSGVAQYFVYSAYGDYISLYQIFNPFICILIMNYLILNIFEFKMKRYYLNWLLHLGVTLLFLMWSYTTTGGNLIIQSSMICILFMIVWKKEFYLFPLLCCFMNFYSSTGSLIAFVSVVSILIYLLIFYNIRLTTIIFLTTFMWIWMPFNVFVDINSIINKTIYYLIYVFEILMLIIPCLLLILLRKKIFKNLLITNKYSLKIISNKWFIISIVAVFVFTIIMYPIYIFLIEDSPHFPKLMTLTFIVFAIILFVNEIFTYKKNKNFNNEFSFLLLNSFISTILFLLIIPIPQLNSNASIWRINYAITWMGNVPDIVFFSLLVILFLMKKYKFIFKKEKILITSKLFLSSILIVVSIVSYFMAFNYGSVSQIKFSSNVERNVSFFTKKDKNAIKELIINNDTRILTSTRAFSLLGMGKDISNEFTQPLLNTWQTPWTLNTYGFIGGIQNIYNYSSSTKKDEIKQLNITLEKIKDTISSINLDYLIVNKFEDKYVDKAIYKNVYSGDNILIFTK